MHGQQNTHKKSTCLVSMDLRTNSDYISIRVQH